MPEKPLCKRRTALIGARRCRCRKLSTNLLDGYSDLIKRENVIGISKFDTKKSDLLFLIINEIKKDFESTDYYEDMYVFIRMLIHGYKSEKKFIDLIDYFLVLNSKKDLSSLEPEQQKRLSIFYKYFHLIESGEAYKRYNDNYLKDFSLRIQHLKEKADEEEKKIKDKISNLIKNEIERKLELGIKADGSARARTESQDTLA
jgi:hypothetical protein